MELPFSDGDYPIKQVIFINLDSVLGSVLNFLIKHKYGTFDIIHQLRSSPDESKLDLLLKTKNAVVSTCWDSTTTLTLLPQYLAKRGWTKKDVRVYSLGIRLDN